MKLLSCLACIQSSHVSFKHEGRGGHEGGEILQCFGWLWYSDRILIRVRVNNWRNPADGSRAAAEQQLSWAVDRRQRLVVRLLTLPSDDKRNWLFLLHFGMGSFCGYCRWQTRLKQHIWVTWKSTFGLHSGKPETFLRILKINWKK